MLQEHHLLPPRFHRVFFQLFKLFVEHDGSLGVSFRIRLFVASMTNEFTIFIILTGAQPCTTMVHNHAQRKQKAHGFHVLFCGTCCRRANDW